MIAGNDRKRVNRAGGVIGIAQEASSIIECARVCDRKHNRHPDSPKDLLEQEGWGDVLGRSRAGI